MRGATPRVTKKSLILEYVERQRPEMVGRNDVAAIHRDLRQRLGVKGRVSDRYLLRVIEEQGVSIDASLGGLPADLLAVLKFDTLLGAAAAIDELESRRQAAIAAGDRAAEDACIRAGRRARENADWVARNTRVRWIVRAERAEIASWFRVWLETPEVFRDWLEVRRRSPEFAERFLV
jgi:hypothetical protein